MEPGNGKYKDIPFGKLLKIITLVPLRLWKQEKPLLPQANICQSRQKPANSTWSAPQGSGSAMTESRAENGCSWHTLLSLLWRVWLRLCQEESGGGVRGDGKPVLIQITSMRLCQKHANIYSLCFPTLPLSSPHNPWSTFSKPLESWRGVWKWLV